MENDGQTAYYFVITSKSSVCIISYHIRSCHNHHSKYSVLINCHNIVARCFQLSRIYPVTGLTIKFKYKL